MMRLRISALALVGLLGLGSLAGCTDDGGGDGGDDPGSRAAGPGKVGVILPDTDSSQRWGSDDPKLLKAAFDDADVPVDIRNAQGDRAEFVRIAESMIAEGARVLMIANLDSVSGGAVLEKARQAGLKTIDYDRLTLNGGADFYVSFDNRAVGDLQGKGLVRCLTERGAKTPVVASLNGSPTDNNATLFKEGYDAVLQRLYDEGTYVKGPDQFVTDWEEEEAETVFREMWSQTGKQINGVLAANDTLGGAAINVLKKDRRNGVVPVTGQDASVEGLQNILAGDQCMTVYKPIKDEAGAAADLAIQLYNGTAPTTRESVKDTESGGYVPAVLLKPRAVFLADVGSVITDGFVEREAVCAGRFAALCDRHGIG